MKADRKQMEEEAISRMLRLGLHPYAVREFKEEGKLNRSEGAGILYWLTEEEQQMVKEFEENHNKVVYHLIKTPTNIGQQLVYVKNMDADDCSEFGSIGIKRTIAGGLARTW